MPDPTLGGPGSWQPFHESFRRTLTRNVTLALALGGIVAWRTGRLALWPVVSCLALWLTLGGHYVEVAYLNRVRPRLARSAIVRAAVRIVIWFVGGVMLGLGVIATMHVLSGAQGLRRPAWWKFGVILIVAELIVHAVFALRRQPSVYDGAG